MIRHDNVLGLSVTLSVFFSVCDVVPCG